VTRPASTYRVHGVAAASGDETELWIEHGRITYEKVPDAHDLGSGWILPGLVDAHCHVGLAAQGAVDRETAQSQARTDLLSGVTLIRDAGSPIDTHWLDATPDMPRIIRAGRHIARPRRYIRGFGVEIEPEDLVEEVRRQARSGDGWVKLVGDWIDRDLGDLAPLWPEDVARGAILAAHEEGARVTAHCFGEDSVSELVRAGIDCIEHGCGLDEATIAVMAERGVALVPTLDNIKIFPSIADQADDRFPRYAAHMRHLYQRRAWVVRTAVEAGVEVYAGTDAGGTRPHGTILEEISALADALSPQYAVGAASWRTRKWLGAPDLFEGAPADLVLVPSDPCADVGALERISVIMNGVLCSHDS